MEKVSEEQYHKFSSAMHLINRRLSILNHDLNSIFPEGITNSELNVLNFIKTHPEAYLKEISQGLGMASSTMTSVIDRLVQRDLVQRIISGRNRHSYSLTLTEKGIQTSVLHEDAEKNMWKNILGVLKNDEQETLIKLLETISRNL